MLGTPEYQEQLEAGQEKRNWELLADMLKDIELIVGLEADLNEGTVNREEAREIATKARNLLLTLKPELV